jgi:hypothetical protein
MGDYPLDLDEPIRLAFWDVCADIVRDNVRRFSEATGISVEADCVAGDYEAEIGGRLAAGRGPDVFYAQRAEAALWAEHGLIEPLDEREAPVAEALAGMDAALVEGARHADGRLLGTTYYNGGPFALFLRPGEEAEPESWDALLDICRRAKRDGAAEHPFVPRWHATQTGLVWSILAHLASEGVTDLADPAAQAGLAEVLDLFAALVHDDLVPPASLADTGDRPALERWARGRHVVTFTVDYLAADAAEIAGRPVSRPAARLPGRAGTPLMPGHALVCLRRGTAGARHAAALRLAGHLGGREVHRRWLRERLFCVPRSELLDQPETRGAVGRHFAAGEADQAVERLAASRRRAVVSPPSRRPGMLAWTREADALVRGALLGERRIGPAEAAERLVASWGRLEGAHR